MIAFVVTLLALFGTGNCLLEQVPFSKCKHGNTVLTVVIEPCNKSPVKQHGGACVLARGTLIKAQAVFIAPFNTSNVELIGHAKINGYFMPIPGTGSNPCVGRLSPQCPLVKDEVYIFTHVFDIQGYYPLGMVEVKIALRDRKKMELIGCAVVSVIVTRE